MTSRASRRNVTAAASVLQVAEKCYVAPPVDEEAGAVQLCEACLSPFLTVIIIITRTKIARTRSRALY